MPSRTQNKAEIYHTNDLPFSAYLLAKGKRLAYISADKNRKVVMFCFEVNQEMNFEKEYVRFINRDTLVDPIAFLESKRYLKFAIKNALYGDEDSQKEIYKPMYEL